MTQPNPNTPPLLWSHAPTAICIAAAGLGLWRGGAGIDADCGPFTDRVNEALRLPDSIDESALESYLDGARFHAGAEYAADDVKAVKVITAPVRYAAPNLDANDTSFFEAALKEAVLETNSKSCAHIFHGRDGELVLSQGDCILDSKEIAAAQRRMIEGEPFHRAFRVPDVWRKYLRAAAGGFRNDYFFNKGRVSPWQPENRND